MINRISILTICPEILAGIHEVPVVRRAERIRKLKVDIVDIRSYVEGCFRKVDDSPYGGGPGMILRIGPIMDALSDLTKGGNKEDTCIAVMSPIGQPYRQETAEELLSFSHLLLVCGHYEGIDARIYDHADRILSVGDYILSGGEIPAMAVTDSVVRLIPGVLKEESLAEESFSDGLLEYPQYTRPYDYHGEKVPDVLLSGDHEAIRKWRREQAVLMTGKYRPELMENNVSS